MFGIACKNVRKRNEWRIPPSKPWAVKAVAAPGFLREKGRKREEGRRQSFRRQWEERMARAKLSPWGKGRRGEEKGFSIIFKGFGELSRRRRGKGGGYISPTTTTAPSKQLELAPKTTTAAQKAKANLAQVLLKSSSNIQHFHKLHDGRIRRLADNDRRKGLLFRLGANVSRDNF